jgi:hypothetical protein
MSELTTEIKENELENLYLPYDSKILGGESVRFIPPNAKCTGLYANLIMLVKDDFFTKKFIASKDNAEIFKLCGQKIAEIFTSSEENPNNPDVVRLILLWSTNGGFDIMDKLISLCFPDLNIRRLKPEIYAEAFAIAAQEILA